VRFFSGIVAGAKFEGFAGVFEGVLGKPLALDVVIDGENVVRCVVNVEF